MNGSELLREALAGLDLKYVDEAMRCGKRKKRRRYIARILAAAACLALVVYGGARLLVSDGQVKPTADPNLPVLDISHSAFIGSSGSAMLYMPDFSEYLTGNPWSEDMDLTTLPVYANALEHASYEQNCVVLNADREAMYAMLGEAIAALGLDADGFEFSESYESTMPWTDGGEEYLSSLTAEDGGTRIQVSADLTLTISFDTPVELPVSFTDESAPEKCEKAGECAAEMFSELLGFENPRVSVSGGDRDYSGERNYSVSIYDAGESSEDTLVNYSFYRASVYLNDSGGLYGICISRPDLSNKVGDYPIISVPEALELLLSGGSVPVTYAALRSEDVAGVELIYHVNEYNEYFVPYYRFYMEAGADTIEDIIIPEGCRAYNCYDVPAIEAKYIA